LLQAYRAHRTIVVDGVCASLKQATLGITAGSGFATEELACLLLDISDDVLKCYPKLDLTEYVDDGQAGPSLFNVDILSSATDYVIDKLEKELGLRSVCSQVGRRC